MRNAFLSVLCLVFFVSPAQAQEVVSPWGNGGTQMQPTQRRPQPDAHGQQVALLPRGPHVPPWVEGNVLNPWSDNAGTPYASTEAQLSDALRTRATRIAACFPPTHRQFRVFHDLSAAPQLVVSGESAACLSAALRGLSAPAGDYRLALRFDEQGLREVVAVTRTVQPARGTARGGQADLLPLPANLPGWARQEVLNPWDDGSRVPYDASLTEAARQRATAIAECFPDHHNQVVAWSELRIHSSTRAGGRYGRCLTRALRGLRTPRAEVYSLALHFDESGLREVFVFRDQTP